MHDVIADLKALRLHGMASAWADLMAQGTASTESSRWLIEHLLEAETTDRAMRSVSYQMNAAKFPVHRDLADLTSILPKSINIWCGSWRPCRLPTPRRTQS